MYYEKRSCQLTQRLKVKGSLLKKKKKNAIKHHMRTFKVTFKKLSETGLPYSRCV